MLNNESVWLVPGTMKRGGLSVPALIYDFRAIGGTRKQRRDDWWQPAKPELEPKTAECIASEDSFDPLTRFSWGG